MAEEDNEGKQSMTVFTAGEKIRESVFAVGDIKLFRPMSIIEIFVGIPICALIAFGIMMPLTNGTWAISMFIVLVYFAPKGLILIEAQAGRPIAAEAAATLRYLWTCVTGKRIYVGMKRLNGRDHPHERERVKEMLEAENEEHEERIAVTRPR